MPLLNFAPHGGTNVDLAGVEVRIAGVSRFPVRLLLSSVDENSGLWDDKEDQRCAGGYCKNCAVGKIMPQMPVNRTEEQVVDDLGVHSLRIVKVFQVMERKSKS